MSISAKGILIGIGLIIIGATTAYLYITNNLALTGLAPFIPTPWTKNDSLSKIEKFKSEQDFKDYLSKSPSSTSGFDLNGVQELALPNAVGAPALKSTDQVASAPDRYSQTNVQVTGIDEPDIVKTDGKEIYISSPQSFGVMMKSAPSMMIDPGEPGIMPPRPSTGGVTAVTSFPPQKMHVYKTTEKSGDLLLKDKNLIVIGDQYPRKIYSFNVSNLNKSAQNWVYELKNNNDIVASRLYGDKIYLVTRTQLNPINPCPIIPLIAKGDPFNIPCTNIYHPITPIPADVTYTAFIININSGSIEKTISFIGSSSDSIVYMSPQSLYISYFNPGDYLSYFVNFLHDNKDLFPSTITNRLEKLKDYDISQQSKMTELSQILEQYQSSLDNDARLKLENEMQNQMETYGKKHNRELGKTGLVKISVNGLNIQASGSIPGKPLNQFSLDEFQNNLRVATTVGDNNQQNSANDVYVLDSNLNIIGTITDLGLTEKIYSARFIGNRGYLVTFRQTDPFYVLDLGNPRAPKMTGELKIPGFSSYLHPLKDNQILGVGQESGKVKLSLFDVANPNNPQELAKYSLNDYWTEVSNNHHAFQQDAKHQIFFLPGGQGAYIFSYEGNNLRLVKALSQLQSKRALYINDYLYVVGDQKITVLDETSWNKVKELDL